MATMYPPAIAYKEPPVPSSEQRVYNALRDQLDAHFVIFHSAAWLGRGAKNQLRDGEGDFIILHPQHGVLVIEVKGGRISVDATRPANEQWQTMDRHDQVHILKQSPFSQASQTKYALKAKIFDLPNWRNQSLIFGHAVIFPDVVADFEVVPLEVDPVILIDGRDLGNLAARIRSIYAHWRGNQAVLPLRMSEQQKIIQLLAPSGELKPRLSTRLGNDQAQIITLTKQQYRVLDLLRRQRQTLIAGCAGSGKTMLALEKAIRLARDEGMHVLLLCYNKRLANLLKTQTHDVPNLVVHHFHEFCREIGLQAGLNVEQSATMDTTTYFDDFLPEQLLLASERVPNLRFDALIVDEGQDFKPNWWDSLLEFLHPNPIIYIFYDDNQNIYMNERSFPVQGEPYILDVNYRNTQHIHHAVRSFYRGDDADGLMAQGPEGETIDVRFFADADAERTLLNDILTALRDDERIPANHITILTRYTPERLRLVNKTIGGFVVNDPARPNQVLCCTIQSYKGLESPIIILTGLGELTGEQEQSYIDTLFYVGCSRASSHLIVLLPKTASAKVRRAFKSNE